MAGMEGLRHTLFEDPLYVYITLGIAELAIGAIGYERRTRRMAALLLIPPVLAGGAALLAWAVVTDREQIADASRDILRDVEAGRLDAVEHYLHEDFAGKAFGSREVAVSEARKALDRYKVTSAVLRLATIEVEEGRGRMECSIVVTLSGSDVPIDRHPMNWELLWRKQPAAEGNPWRIIEATPSVWMD